MVKIREKDVRMNVNQFFKFKIAHNKFAHTQEVTPSKNKSTCPQSKGNENFMFPYC